MTHARLSAVYAPRLQRLRSLITNTTRFPHLTGKRLLSCELRRMPGYFSKTTMKEKK